MKQRNHNKVSQGMLTLILILIVGFFIGAVIYILSHVIQQEQPVNSNGIHESNHIENIVDKVQEQPSLCVIKYVDTENKNILLYDTTKDRTIELTYTGATDIRNKYNDVISASQLVLGDMAEVVYSEGTQMIQTLKNSQSSWEVTGVSGLIINRTEKWIKMYEEKYKYSSKLYVRDQDGEIALLSINGDDVLTVRGHDKTIYSVSVTKGHGSVALKNAHFFEGGLVSIGGKDYHNITADMVFTVREGATKFVVEKDETVVELPIEVLRNQEISIDLGVYTPNPEQKGLVTFVMNPFGAELLIDDTLTSYANPIELNYGEHTIEVSLNGYETYVGTYVLQQSTDIVQITLSETLDKQASDEEATDTSENDETSNDNDSSQEDTSHFITIKGPSGVSVYINGAYKGIAPIKLVKPLGVTYITLVKEGYEQITHTVNIEDDDEDKSFTFNNLELSEEEETETSKNAE